jgi:hypothetical protein
MNMIEMPTDQSRQELEEAVIQSLLVLATWQLNFLRTQMQRLLEYLDSLQKIQPERGGNAGQHFALRLETRLARTKEDAVMSFRVTDDPKAPEVTLREEDVLKTYSLTYDELTKTMKRRYEDFLSNEKYHSLRRPLESNKKLCLLRALNPSNPKSARQRFYNPNILVEFDKHYKKRKKGG